MSNFVFIKNVFRQDLKKQYIKQFNDNHLLVLLYLQRFTVINRNETNFCLGWLFDDLNINKSDTRKDIINSFFDLVDWGLVELTNDIDRDKFNRNTRITTYAVGYEDNYTMIYDTEIDKILKLDIDFRVKKTMLFLYCNIASRIDSKGYCYPSFASFKNDMDTTSDNRVNDALVLLKENKLIDYDNVGQILVNKQVQQGNNVYVVCVDEDYKDNLSKGLANRKKDYEDNKVSVFESVESNSKRSNTARMNHLSKLFDDDAITDEQKKELLECEESYYNYYKLDKSEKKQNKISQFRLFEVPTTNNKKRMIDVDMETGEILEVWGEPNPMNEIDKDRMWELFS